MPRPPGGRPTARVIRHLSPALSCVLVLACAKDSPPPPPGLPDTPALPPAPPAAATTPEGRTRAASTPTDPPEAKKVTAQAAPKATEPDPFIEGLLEQLRPRWASVLDDPARYRLEFLVTPLPKHPASRRGDGASRRGDGASRRGESAPPELPPLQTHAFREDAEYVYPASAIKTFASVAALRELQRLREAYGSRLSLDTPLAFCSLDAQRCRRDADASNLDGGTVTLGHEIRKMQLVSNNTAFNRLMQFVGFDRFHATMAELGFRRTRVHHPLWVGRAEADLTTSPAVEMRPARGKPVRIPQRVAEHPPAENQLPRTLIGSAYLDEDADKARVDEPMDFGRKNFVALRDFHDLTLAIALAGDPRVRELGLSPRHLRFLRRAMTQDPLASENPKYTDESKSELRYKVMLDGVLRVRARPQLEYLSKAGRAFGFHIENAYVRDRRSGRAFVITAVIYVNEDGVLNDDLYDYDGVSRPFLKDLGEAVARAVFEGEPDAPERPAKDEGSR